MKKGVAKLAKCENHHWRGMGAGGYPRQQIRKTKFS